MTQPAKHQSAGDETTAVRVVEAVMEAAVVPSFTKIGPRVRACLHDWEPIDVDLSGQRALVTGGTSGIGRAVAAGLIALGAEVIVTSRDRERAAEAADQLIESTDRGTAQGLALDTSDHESVLAVARAVSDGGPLHMLLHNAGALSDDYRTNEQGMELTLASHLVGPYLLTTELRPTLAVGARIVWMSSGGMYTQRLDVDALEMSEAAYRGAVAYAKAKRAQVELVAFLGPQWAPDVIMQAMHPGWVDTPGVEQGLPGFGRVMKPLLRSADEGADTMVWLAATGGEGAEPGQFWLDRRPRRTSYLPSTRTDDAERRRLLEWLERQVEPAPSGR